MILVTGATGNIGRVLLRELAERGAGRLRGLTRDAANAGLPGDVEAVEGDLADADFLGPALEGVRSLFLPAGLGDDAEVVGAARRAGVEHVVLVSSITVRTHPHLPAAGRNLAAEESLRASGMDWTILRPTQFASNALWWAEAIREHGEVRVPYADTGLPAVHPGDIAAVALHALTEPGHRGRTYPLTGPGLVTARQQLAALSDVLGRELTLVETGRGEAHREMAPLMGDETASAVLDLMGGDTNDELLRIHDTVELVTGSPAAPFGRWASENAAAFR
ncbi:NAD(P)H-binding protein [Nocardiopsis sp. NPDC006198]|uniref:SDR family oxidoreductase n=1 Tax=Nocardiopsis sp. NPDC006198 TaxID=3154472 RepID=UPI0033B01A8A